MCILAISRQHLTFDNVFQQSSIVSIPYRRRQYSYGQSKIDYKLCEVSSFLRPKIVRLKFVNLMCTLPISVKVLQSLSSYLYPILKSNVLL